MESVIDNPALLNERKRQVSALYGLWSSLIPEGTPNEHEFYTWLDRFGPNIAERGIRRTADKARQRRKQRSPMDVDDAGRYASATMRNMERQHRA